MSKYKYLIFDVDDTLLNFFSAFQSAQTAIAEKLNIPCTKEYMELDEKCGWKAWKESDLDNTNHLSAWMYVITIQDAKRSPMILQFNMKYRALRNL